jgi:hypothetical protein
MVGVSVSGVWSWGLNIYMGPTVDGLRGVLFDKRYRKGGAGNTLSAVLYTEFTYHCNIIYYGDSANISPKTIHSRTMQDKNESRARNF